MKAPNSLDTFLKSIHFKILFPVVVAAIVISLWQNGYEFGKFLREKNTPETSQQKVTPTPESETTVPKVSEPQVSEEKKELPEYLQIVQDGSNLKFETVLAKESSYTRYQISYQSEGLKISGVMNIPNGTEKYPLVILNHGYIDPAVYTLGRGLKREQDFLARNGFAVLHTDYRNHALSDDDASMLGTGSIMRTKKYGADAFNAVLAVQEAVKNNAPEVQHIDSEKVAMLGHSMGGGVTMFALVSAPELVDAAILYAPVHINEYYNFQKWGKTRLTPEQFEVVETMIGDTDTPENFRSRSPLGYIENISAPVQMYFGTLDDSCPIAWGDDIESEFQKAGKPMHFIRYEGEYHEFGPRWDDFMSSSVEFLQLHLK